MPLSSFNIMLTPSLIMLSLAQWPNFEISKLDTFKSNSSICTLSNPSPCKLTLIVIFGEEDFYGFTNISNFYMYFLMFWIMVLVLSSFFMESNTAGVSDYTSNFSFRIV